jgi:hypothetical protein
MGQYRIKQWAINRAKSKAVSDLQRQSTDVQVAFLTEALNTGLLTPALLRKNIEHEAPGQMRKAADGIVRKGGIPTVDRLLGDYNTVPGFKELTIRLGITEEWFRGQAEAECAKRQVKVITNG